VLSDEWWEITHNDNLNYLDKVFQKDEQMRRAVRQSLLAMTLVVTACYAYSIEHTNSKLLLPTKLLTRFKKATFYSH
jgi:hypothetical protein